MFDTEYTAGYSFCQEPGLVLLPDGRLFASMRTPNGQIWYNGVRRRRALVAAERDAAVSRRRRADGEPGLAHAALSAARWALHPAAPEP